MRARAVEVKGARVCFFEKSCGDKAREREATEVLESDTVLGAPGMVTPSAVTTRCDHLAARSVEGVSSSDLFRPDSIIVLPPFAHDSRAHRPGSIKLQPQQVRGRHRGVRDCPAYVVVDVRASVTCSAVGKKVMAEGSHQVTQGHVELHPRMLACERRKRLGFWEIRSRRTRQAFFTNKAEGTC